MSCVCGAAVVGWRRVGELRQGRVERKAVEHGVHASDLHIDGRVARRLGQRHVLVGRGVPMTVVRDECMEKTYIWA